VSQHAIMYIPYYMHGRCSKPTTWSLLQLTMKTCETLGIWILDMLPCRHLDMHGCCCSKQLIMKTWQPFENVDVFDVRSCR
jgi:hypothetical protein